MQKIFDVRRNFLWYKYMPRVLHANEDFLPQGYKFHKISIVIGFCTYFVNAKFWNNVYFLVPWLLIQHKQICDFFILFPVIILMISYYPKKIEKSFVPLVRWSLVLNMAPQGVKISKNQQPLLYMYHFLTLNCSKNFQNVNMKTKFWSQL